MLLATLLNRFRSSSPSPVSRSLALGDGEISACAVPLLAPLWRSGAGFRVRAGFANSLTLNRFSAAMLELAAAKAARHLMKSKKATEQLWKLIGQSSQK